MFFFCKIFILHKNIGALHKVDTTAFPSKSWEFKLISCKNSKWIGKLIQKFSNPDLNGNVFLLGIQNETWLLWIQNKQYLFKKRSPTRIPLELLSVDIKREFLVKYFEWIHNVFELHSTEFQMYSKWIQLEFQTHLS